MIHTNPIYQPTDLLHLELDVQLLLFDFLDNRSLAALALTCKYFASLVRSVISYRQAKLEFIDQCMPSSPPFLNYRAGVAVGSTFYMPFINESSFCYAYDLHSGVWSFHKLHLIEHDVIYPQVTCAAVLGKKIYLVCGRLLNSYTLSNGMIEIDTTNFNMRIVKDAKGVPPRPRHEHSIDAIGDRYLVLFGGLCYNSVGENDVFVYDQHENKWFIPPISGHLPHLRFGHASAVIGKNLFIQGGAQLDNDSSYIVFDDLHKLDCETWTWYKYDHPEKERYLRHQTSEKETVNSPQEDYVIPTYGDSPYDRFQAFMCSHGSKLIIFGGHSIREDDDDNEILCSYSVDELCIFNTKRKVWSTTRAAIIDRAVENDVKDGEETYQDEPVTVSDMSIAQFLIDSNGLRVFIIAGRKAPEKTTDGNKTSSKFMNYTNNTVNDSISMASSSNKPDQCYPPLSSISEISPLKQRRYLGDDNTDDASADDSTENIDKGNLMADYFSDPKEELDGSIDGNEDMYQGDIKTPTSTEHCVSLQELIRAIEPDLRHRKVNGENRDCDIEKEIIDECNQRQSTLRHNTSIPGKRVNEEDSFYSSQSTCKRPATAIVHRSHQSDENDSLYHMKTNSMSEHSSYTTSSTSEGQDKVSHEYQQKITPCAMMLEILE